MTAVLVLAAACYLLRTAFVLLPAERLPSRVRDALVHLGPAVLGALVATEVQGATRGSSGAVTAVLLGAVLAIGLVVRLTRSVGLAIALATAVVLVLDLA